VAKKPSIFHERDVQAKILGVTLIIIGLLLLLIRTPLLLKFSFTLILIGVLMILLITEQTIPRKLHSAQLEGNLGFVNKLIDELELTGKAVFLPKSRILTEERVFIPMLNTPDAQIPYIDDDIVVTKGGLSVPPSGLNLLKKIQQETSFENIGLENVEEKLQTFVGLNILRSVSLKKQANGWKLQLERPTACEVMQPTCSQYPCAACSAVLTAIAQASGEKIWLKESIRDGKKTIYHLKIGD